MPSDFELPGGSYLEETKQEFVQVDVNIATAYNVR